MVELDQFKYTLSTYEEPLKELRDSLQLTAKKERIAELERYMEAPDFWLDPDKSQKISRELKNLQDTVKSYQELETMKEEIEILLSMGYEENDASVLPEIEETLEHFTTTIDKMRVQTLLSGEYDSNNAILRLNAGAGGTESCDWASILYRMYTRWAESKGFGVEVLDYLDGDEAGIKSVTIQINGENAFGLLKSERGVHRLVRISPFNAAGKRQTRVCTDLCASRLLMRRESARPPLYHSMSCRISKKIWMLRSTMMICVSIRTAPVVPADSMSTRLLPQSVSPICPLVS